MSKKIFAYLLAAFCAVLTAVLIAIPVVTGTGISKSEFRVVIDAGHGYPDGGTKGITSGVNESDLNLAIAQSLAKLCKRYKIEPILTRTGKDALVPRGSNFKKRDMEKRKEIIEKAQPDLVISIHLNKFGDHSRKGAQVFFDNNNEEGKRLAACLQASLNALNHRNYTALKGDYYILNCTTYPSAIAECGFLSNPDDEKKLQTAQFQAQLAEKILEGIVQFLLGK